MTARYCTECGARCSERVPEGDDRTRAVCTACGTVHYENPKSVVGCLVEHGDALLLCRRAIEPARGLWTFPAGFLENGETLAAGAARETREEALAEVEVGALHSLLDVPHIAQVYVVFRARFTAAPTYGAGQESLESALVQADSIPWGQLAFPTVALALRLWDEDRRQQARRVHRGTVRWTGEGSRFDLERYRLEDHSAEPLR